ncbi:MAG TPA: winged helix-turn-helix domain-containing protein [Kofleriaceae bacterium]
MAGADREEPRLRTIRVGDFELDPESGMLSRPGDGGRGERMQPKPAALLAMLLERRGGLVTRAEIREQLWSDVTVDFDNSLNYCVRQVRQAFGDSADAPRYIETVPGRGYRLKPELFMHEAAPVATQAVAPAVTPAVAPERRGLSRRTWIAVGIGGVVLAAGGWLALRDRNVRLRIAILPFAHPAMSPALALHCNQIEARVLADLTTRGRDFADVVGPLTTAPLVAKELPVQRIATTLGAHHVVNARFIRDAPNAEILFELIRASDGAHIYVQRVSDLSAVDTLAETIVSGMLAALAAERSAD